MEKNYDFKNVCDFIKKQNQTTKHMNLKNSEFVV